jgi:hypothetical protein
MADAAAHTATIRVTAQGTLDFRFMETLLQIIDNDVMDCSRFDRVWARWAGLLLFVRDCARVRD